VQGKEGGFLPPFFLPALQPATGGSWLECPTTVQFIVEILRGIADRLAAADFDAIFHGIETTYDDLVQG
jgi:hypothetical protein